MAWTVSFEKTVLNEKAAEILKDFDFEIYGDSRVDMEENDFFNFEEALADNGIKIPVDGGNSWAKGGI